MSEIRKSRDLTTSEYVEQLQLEYIVAELREKIYPDAKDRAYWSRVMALKREKIENIASRNSIPCIFSKDAPELKNEIYRKIYNPIGLPNFIYKDETQRANLRVDDIKFYYFAKSEVKIYEGKELCFGVILTTNLDAELIQIQFKKNGKIGVYPMNVVTRIL
jgi:hypothetical protein